MDPESKEKLEEISELAEENNQLLKKVRRGLKIGRIMRLTYWAFLLLGALGAYYFVQPYVEEVQSFFKFSSDFSVPFINVSN